VINADELVEGIGKTILQSALEFDADLIVMGAYGETRLKEVVLGGVTRFMLKHTTIPLFLSH
jgi:nucleotide-binding universal stress UspA family protein